MPRTLGSGSAGHDGEQLAEARGVRVLLRQVPANAPDDLRVVFGPAHQVEDLLRRPLLRQYQFQRRLAVYFFNVIRVQPEDRDRVCRGGLEGPAGHQAQAAEQRAVDYWAENARTHPI